MSKRAEQFARKLYTPWSEDGMSRKDNTEVIEACIKGYEQAEKDLIPLINRLCEAILFDWEDKAELARKIQSQIKEETK